MTYQEQKAKLPKYYTPDIAEFHIGFEYERLYTDNTWQSEVMDYSSISSYTIEDILEDMSYDKGFIRVKYLDQEDIEDLGFPFKASILQDFYGDVEFYKKPDVYGYMIWKLRLQHRPETQWLKLEALFEDGVWSTLFEGRIKNKSELKKLLKQIGYGTEEK